MNRREASKIETKNLILQAAKQLFRKKRVEECTMRTIAARAGVSPASVIVHFKSKIALLEEALEGEINSALTELMVSMSNEQDFIDRFMHLSTGMLRFYEKNRDLYRELVRYTLLEPTEENPKITKQVEAYMQLLTGMVEQEKSKGRLRQDLNPVHTAGSFFSLYLGTLITFFRIPDMTSEAAADILASMAAEHVKGIIPE